MLYFLSSICWSHAGQLASMYPKCPHAKHVIPFPLINNPLPVSAYNYLTFDRRAQGDLDVYSCISSLQGFQRADINFE